MENISKPRWGLPGGHPPKEHPPLNTQLLEDAIEYLGHWEKKHKKIMQRRISFIVALHRELRSLDEDPIRDSNIRNNVSCVQKSANLLRSHIATLDFLSLRKLHQHRAFEHPALVEPLSDTERRSDEFQAICELQDSRLLSMLDSIVKASGQALAELPEKDPGGTVKQRILGGSANDELVAGCHKLFRLYRPGEASTTAGGDFRTFVSLVYRLSTGEGAGVDLEGPIKKHIRNFKRGRNIR